MATKPDQSEGMAGRYRLAMLRCREDLVEDLRLELPGLLDRLLQEKVIGLEERDTILEESRITWNRARASLDILNNKDDRAIEVFVHFLKTQTHLEDLYNSLMEAAKTFTEEEVSESEKIQFMEGRGFTVDILQQHLRDNLSQKLNEWSATAVEEMGTGEYIPQPIAAQESTTHGAKQLDVTNMGQLLQKSPTGARILVKGDAGMGKSRMVKHLTNSWIERETKPTPLAKCLAAKFKAVIPIPLRLVKGHPDDTIQDIICHAGLLPPKLNKPNLRKVLEGESKATLYLLDSHEELTIESRAISALIKGTLFPDATVIVTSRSDSRLTEIQQQLQHYTTAQLQDLSENEVAKYMEQYQHQEIVSKLGTFLRRPINLILTGSLLSKMSGQGATGGQFSTPTTQTELFSQLTQYLLLVFAKKRRFDFRGGSFSITTGSPLSNQTIPLETRHFLKEVGKLCYEALRDKKQVLITEGSQLSAADLIEFGLFTLGPDGTVRVPHPLFMEFFTALYLDGEGPARREVLGEVMKMAVNERAPLVGLLKLGLGLENVLRFIVGMSPSNGSHAQAVANTGLLKIQQYKTSRGFQSNLSFPLQLLEECPSKEAKREIVSALLLAPVSVHGYATAAENKGVHHLLDLFDENEQAMFMIKAFGFETTVRDGISVICPTSKNMSLSADDPYVLGYAKKHSSQFEMDKLYLNDCELSTHELASTMSRVREMDLYNCRLHSVPVAVSDSCSHLPLTLRAMEVFKLERVDGLRALSDIIMPSVRKLHICGPVTVLDSLRDTFPGVSVVELKSIRLLDTVSDSVNLQWETVKRLDVTYCDLDLKSAAGNLHRAFPAVSDVAFNATQLQLDAVSHQSVQWRGVQGLWLWGRDYLDQRELTQLQQVFPDVRMLGLSNVALHCSEGAPDLVWHTLRELKLKSSVIVTASEALDEIAARRTLQQMFPAARIDISDYKTDQKRDCALDLMRRLSPHMIEKNVSALIDLVPSLRDDMLSSVDQPLKIVRDKTVGKDYLLCDYNRDGNSFRSPWSNQYDPPLETGALPLERIRKLEIDANAAFDQYREMYFEGGVSSVYLWHLDHGFAGVILMKKIDGSEKIKSCWDSIHVVEIQEKLSGCSAHYKLTSTAMLFLQTSKSRSSTMNLGGPLTRQVETDFVVSESSPHLANIGRMVEDMDEKIRKILNQIYFGKMKDIVNSLRSTVPLGEMKQQENLYVGSDEGRLPANYVNKSPVFKAMYDYEALDEDEVSFKDGDTFIDIEVIDENWMYGTVKRTGKRGMLPANYVKKTDTSDKDGASERKQAPFMTDTVTPDEEAAVEAEAAGQKSGKKKGRKKGQKDCIIS